MTNQELEFLKESNLIEGEGLDALDDSIKAWEYIKPLFPLKIEQLLKCHTILMETRKTIDEEDKGVWSRFQTRVGHQINPEPRKIPALIQAWVDDINSNIVYWKDNKNKKNSLALREEDAKKFHIRYERVHPHLDGNGRTGRIYLNWHRVRIGLSILVIKNSEKYAYYDWFTED